MALILSRPYQYTIVVRRAPYFDLGGKVGSFDKGIDPWFEMPITGGGIRALETSTGKVLAENSFTTQKPNVSEQLFKPKAGEQNVAWTILKWAGNCDGQINRNTPTGKSRDVAAKEVTIVTSQDEGNLTFERLTGAEGVDSIWTGRKYKTAAQFLEAYGIYPNKARDLPPQILEDIRRAAEKEKGIVLPKVSPTPDVPRKPDDKKESEFPWTAAAIAFAGAAIGAGLFLARRRECDDRNTSNTLRGSAPYEINVQAQPYRGQVNLQTTGTLTENPPAQGGQRT